VHREALELWRLGAERERAAPAGRDRLAGVTMSAEDAAEIMDLFALSMLGLLEADRLREAGNMAATWDHLRAALRASRHAGMGGTSNHRSNGQVIATVTVRNVARWAEDPRVDSVLLRRALPDLEAVIAMTPPNSDTFKADYLAMLATLEQPEGWYPSRADDRDGLDHFLGHSPGLFRAARVAWREPERSRRVYRILFAHWLAQADLPNSRRTKMAETRVRDNHTHPDFPYFAAPGRRDAAHPLSSEELYAWFRSTLYGDFLCPPLPYHLSMLDQDRRALPLLAVTLAEALYLREHGVPPERNEDLVEAGYLGHLPEGYATGDPGDEPPSGRAAGPEDLP